MTTPDFGNLWWVVGSLSVIAGLAFTRAKGYLEGVLKDPAKNDHRDFLVSLEAGGDLRQMYVALLSAALDRVDRFMGDAGKAAFSLPSPFGNRTAAPYWTGWSFDRCALIAVIYPFASVFLVWVATKHSGDVGGLLGLAEGAPSSVRGSAFVGVSCTAFALAMGTRSAGWRQFGWLAVAGAVAGAVVVAVAGAGAGALAVYMVAVKCSERNHLGLFWCVYWLFATLGCYLWLGRFGYTHQITTIMLALAVLVPLINMPFDWLSIGITRALLRRGCEPDGAPFWLALLDLLLGLAVLVLLAGALVLGLRLADAAIVSGGGEMLIDVDRQIARIAAAPGDAANYWIYATLFSTLIPSLLNVLIGAVSLGTWLCRPLRRWMLETIPLLETKGDGTRWKLVNAFGAQVFVSVFLAGFMLWGVGYVAVQNRALVGHGYVYVADVIDRHAPW